MAASRMPRVLRVGQHRYTVSRSKAHLRARNEKMDMGFGDAPACEMRPGIAAPQRVMGRFFAWKRRLVVHPDLEPQLARSTLLHESLHMIFRHVGLTEVAVLNDFEETIVNSLEPGIFELLQRNPTFVRYLTDTTE